MSKIGLPVCQSPGLPVKYKRKKYGEWVARKEISFRCTVNSVYRIPYNVKKIKANSPPPP